MVKKVIDKLRWNPSSFPKVNLENKNMFRLAMEHSGIGMALIAPDGTWLKVNQAICDIVGYTASELVKLDFQTITHPDDLEDDLTLLKQLLGGEIQTYNLDKRYFHKNGQLIWAKLTVSLVRDDDQQPLYFISQIQDITAQKKASDELSLANQEMEEFSYRLTHDLCSPLSSMEYVMEMAAKYIEDGDLPNALKTVRITQAGITKLSDLVESVLDVSKIKLQEEDNLPVDVPVVVYKALEALSYMQNYSRLDIETRFDYIGSINTKPQKFMQIIDNLISNAIKYQDTRKPNSFVRISTYKIDGDFILEVRDNGLGVDEIYRDKLFTMFERFHPEASFGTGLGLYMVKKSADILGGSLAYSAPEVGKGSIFRLTLPASTVKLS
ncbi:PAS domain S-box protein [Paraglaciecola sp. L1A13]|uniref:sensor histidine kinase n=1 Tax=Paraglaciecola sp. L1A13 TaxID=2686359 RepID=UPI00131CD1BD|nr:HAMP domain-containing sensor histidine kinase [Paraglaciecola sp. L1A13]